MFDWFQSFRVPYYVVAAALLLTVILLVVIWKLKGRAIALPFDHGQARNRPLLAGLLHLAAALPVILLGIVLLILCGPSRFGEPKDKRILTNIEFCVDISGSMTSQFGDGSRYDASMKAIDAFLDYREGDAFGLTFFGNTVLHWTPLTFDTSAIRCSVPFMRPEVAPPWFGGTMIGKALQACQKTLTEREEGDRMIVLVSDGSSADLFGGADTQIAESLREDNIVVYAVHIAEGGVPDPIVNITAITGGQVFNPGDAEGLAVVFQRIDEMQETKLEKTIAEKLDNYRPLSLAGLVVLAAHVLLSFGLRYTPW